MINLDYIEKARSGGEKRQKYRNISNLSQSGRGGGGERACNKSRSAFCGSTRDSESPVASTNTYSHTQYLCSTVLQW
jgi:hypothetical protein